MVYLDRSALLAIYAENHSQFQESADNVAHETTEVRIVELNWPMMGLNRQPFRFNTPDP